MTRARRRIQDAFDTIRDLLDLAAAQRLEQRGDRPSRCASRSRCGACWAWSGPMPGQGAGFRRGARCRRLRACSRRRPTSSASSPTCSTTPSSTRRPERVVSGHVPRRLADRHRRGHRASASKPTISARVFESFFGPRRAKATGEVGTGLGWPSSSRWSPDSGAPSPLTARLAGAPCSPCGCRRARRSRAPALPAARPSPRRTPP